MMGGCAAITPCSVQSDLVSYSVGVLFAALSVVAGGQV